MDTIGIRNEEESINMRDIKINYNKDDNCIEIAGNKEGLEYISKICLKIIGKNDPGNHFHLTSRMENLQPGSIDTTIIYDPTL